MRTLFIGTLPPPIDGKAVATEAMLDVLKLRKSGGSSVEEIVLRGLPAFKLIRLSLKLSSIVRAWRRAKRKGEPSTGAYLVADNGWGIFLTALYAALLRPHVSQLVVHHHGRRWINRHQPVLRWLLFRPGDVHVTQCPRLALAMERAYPGIYARSLSNAFLVEPPGAPDPVPRVPTPGDPVTLVHISNLTLEKGLDTVIDTARQLVDRGIACRLILGGAPANAKARAYLADALVHCPFIEARGHLDAAGKQAALAEADLFLFPTRYALEMQPIVVLEALAAGVPVVATGLGCLPDVLEAPGGEIAAQEAFVETVARILEHRAATAAAATQASAHARDLFARECETSSRELEGILLLLD